MPRDLAKSAAMLIIAELVLGGHLLDVMLDRSHICSKAVTNVINSIF